MLYSERNGFRKNKEKTDKIDLIAYKLLLDCCEKYKNNLTYKFPKKEYHNFTEKFYTAFDETNFINTLKLLIPDLYINEAGKVDLPSEENYNQLALIDYIEFFAQNIMDIRVTWNNSQYRNFEYIDCLSTKYISNNFRDEINNIFNLAGLTFELNENGNIERINEYCSFVDEIQKDIEKVNEDGLEELLEEAVKLYKDPKPGSQKYAVEKLWDAFERLKTYHDPNKKQSANKLVNSMAKNNNYFLQVFKNEFEVLTEIGNKCRIRHHEVNKVEISEEYYDYLFHRCISLIGLAIKYLDK
jgi:hypothetical protein